MAITPAEFELLRQAFQEAAANKVLLYDIMTERFEITEHPPARIGPHARGLR